ncbi:hypothetical protein H8A97_13020 [Bradyrhizobium sp. Arg62]|uniref:hypothetical protein n=1 Tax=Bradyrhizobium brasilense TaxID=1419277 RepID=UPI001E4F30AB|nr:hypothetical protein [Bradyrhizobium brasilense]MCC8945995.1 hypothetical protein [Bradyrhizobium brasilense]
MANPTAGDVHVNVPLTNISIAFMQNPAGFVADRVFPTVPVLKQSDRYFTYSRADFNRDTMRKRAPGTESAGAGWRVDNTPSYYADVWALHKDIEDQIRANADSPLDMDRDATLFLSQQALINREVNWASNFFTTGKWTGAGVDVSGVAASPAGNSVLQWNDANATPVADVKKYNDAIHLASGFRANKLVMGRQVWSKTSESPSITDRVKYGASPGAPAIITKQAVAALMEIDEIMVMDAIQNTGNENSSEGAGDINHGESNIFIGGKAALLVYAAPAPSIMQPSGGYTFSWTGFMGAGGLGQRIKRFRMEQLESDRVEIQQAYTPKQIASEVGVFFTTLIA